MYSLILYLVNAGINIRVGIAAFRQARAIRRMESSVHGSGVGIQFQHRGFFAIAVLSLVYCVFVVPNALYNTLQAFDFTEQTTPKATGFMRLFGLLADGWCLTLLCPMLRKEGMKMLGCQPKTPIAEVEQAPGNHQPRRGNANRFADDSQIASTGGKANSRIETRDSETPFPVRAPRVSSSPGQAGAQTPPAQLGRGREVLLTPLDLLGATDPSGSHVASCPTSSAPPYARPPHQNRPSWSRHYSR